MMPVIINETDEDEFLDARDHSPAVATQEPALVPRKVPLKMKNTAKRNVVAPRRGEARSGYDLAYFKLWWARMEIEGRKQAREQLRLDDFNLNVTKGARRKRMYVNVRRSQRGVETSEIASFQDQRVVPRSQESLRVGLCLEGENSLMGGGRGSPVSVNFAEVILEQPRVFKTDCTSDTGTGV